jgi:hypothetical protein
MITRLNNNAGSSPKYQISSRQLPEFYSSEYAVMIGMNIYGINIMMINQDHPPEYLYTSPVKQIASVQHHQYMSFQFEAGILRTSW